MDKMNALHRQVLLKEQSVEQIKHQSPNPESGRGVYKDISTKDEPRNGYLSPNYFPYTATEGHKVFYTNREGSKFLTGLEKLTKAQLRNFLNSNEVAKSIIQELIDEKTASATKSLDEEELVRLMIDNPVLGDTFALVAKQALENYKMICKDSYMQALRNVERDNQAWLLTQRGLGDRKGMDVEMGQSPAQEALQNPYDWPLPDIPRSSIQANKRTRRRARAAKKRLANVAERGVNDWMDEDHVEGRLMRQMKSSY